MRRSSKMRLLIFGAVFVTLVVGLSVALRFAGGSVENVSSPLIQPEAAVTEPDSLGAPPVIVPQSPAADNSSVVESSDVAAQRSSSESVAPSQSDTPNPVVPVLPAADISTLSESTDVEVRRSASEGVAPSQNEASSTVVPAISAADTSTLSELADVQVQRSEPAPAGGGRGEAIGVEESVEFIIRDSSGNIKSQGIAK